MSILVQLLNVAWMTALLVVIRWQDARWPLKSTSRYDRFYVCSITVMAGAWILAPLIDLATSRSAILLDFTALGLGVFMADWCLTAWRRMVR